MGKQKNRLQITDISLAAEKFKIDCALSWWCRRSYERLDVNIYQQIMNSAVLDTQVIGGHCLKSKMFPQFCLVHCYSASTVALFSFNVSAWKKWLLPLALLCSFRLFLYSMVIEMVKVSLSWNCVHGRNLTSDGPCRVELPIGWQIVVGV